MGPRHWFGMGVPDAVAGDNKANLKSRQQAKGLSGVGGTPS